MKVAEEGMRWVCGADGAGPGEIAAFQQAVNLTAILNTQAGLLSDMDFVGDVLYERNVD